MNALTPMSNASLGLLMDESRFNHMQRVAKVLAMSQLFPEHLRKGSQETAVANAILVLNMASRLNEDPLTVSQAIYFVGGKPGWSAQYLISKANQHGVFKNPIDWDIKGKGDDLSVTAFGELKSTGKRVQVTCDMKMAQAEGWTKNPKYKSMPEQMLRYRSATFLIRLYCPEVMVGVPAAIENELAMKDVTPDYEPTGVIYEAEAEEEPAQSEAGQKAVKNPSKPDQKGTAPKAQENKAETAPKPNEGTTASKPAEERPTRHKKEEGSGQLPLGDDEPAVDVERWSTLTDMICEEIGQSSADEVMDIYGDQIEQMKATPALKSLVDRIDDALAAAQQ